MHVRTPADLTYADRQTMEFEIVPMSLTGAFVTLC